MNLLPAKLPPMPSALTRWRLSMLAGIAMIAAGTALLHSPAAGLLCLGVLVLAFSALGAIGATPEG